MIARCNHDQIHALQSLNRHGARRVRQGPDDTETAATVEHRLVCTAECLHIEPKRRAGKSNAKFEGRFGDGFDGKKHVDHCGEFRFETAGQKPVEKRLVIVEGEKNRRERVQIGEVKPVVAPTSIIEAFFVAVAIGVFFGFYPANRAASLRPIDALRHE